MMYRPVSRDLVPGDIVLVKVRVGDLTELGTDFVPAEVLTVREDRAEIVLCSGVSRSTYWMSLDKLIQKSKWL
jgi:hypothetical protein